MSHFRQDQYIEVKEEWSGGAEPSGKGKASDQRLAFSTTTCVTMTTSPLHWLQSDHTVVCCFLTLCLPTSGPLHLLVSLPGRFFPGCLTYSLIPFRFLLGCQALDH